jgi:type VI secretion system protein ImpK
MPQIDRVQPVPPPSPPPPSTLVQQKLRFLQPQIDAGQVAVLETPSAVKITIFDFGGGMFDSGRAELRENFRPLLKDIGDALDGEPGTVVVAGHTDSRPIIHSFRFASNYELSVARAEAAGAILRAELRDPGRLSTVGYAAQRPCDSRNDETGWAHNRRIEIILQRPPG